MSGRGGGPDGTVTARVAPVDGRRTVSVIGSPITLSGINPRTPSDSTPSTYGGTSSTASTSARAVSPATSAGRLAASEVTNTGAVATGSTPLPIRRPDT